MKKEATRKVYNSKIEDYKRLGQNIVEALKMFLKDKGISYLEIYYRIKEFDSFNEKIERKGYKNPFIEIEDICGVRVICYYSTDIPRICEIIKNEFSIIEEQDKSELLGLKEFAYRSQHFIVKIAKNWTKAPTYRGLELLKSEIQVRTVLMHAWAEIEHKLNYKSDAQVPDKFQRKLFRLSAKFEEADEQFDELRAGIEDYQKTVSDKLKENIEFDITQNFNIDTFKAFLRFHNPDDPLEEYKITQEFEELSKRGKNFATIQDAILTIKPHFNEIISDLDETGYLKDSEEEPSSILIALAMDIVDDETFRRRKNTVPEWRGVVKKRREKIKSASNV